MVAEGGQEGEMLWIEEEATREVFGAHALEYGLAYLDRRPSISYFQTIEECSKAQRLKFHAYTKKPAMLYSILSRPPIFLTPSPL